MSTFCVVSLRYSRYVLASPKFSSARLDLVYHFSTASLTRLDVQFNSLGEEGEALLRKAVEGRSGLELKL